MEKLLKIPIPTIGKLQSFETLGESQGDKTTHVLQVDVPK